MSGSISTSKEGANFVTYKNNTNNGGWNDSKDDSRYDNEGEKSKDAKKIN